MYVLQTAQEKVGKSFEFLPKLKRRDLVHTQPLYKSEATGDLSEFDFERLPFPTPTCPSVHIHSGTLVLP